MAIVAPSARTTSRRLLIRSFDAHPVRHVEPSRRCGAVHRAAGPSDPHPPGRPHHRRLRPGRRGRVRAHAEPRAHHRARQAALPPALAAAMGRHGRHAVGPRRGHPRLDDRLDGADASPRGDATAARSQDRAACRGTRPRSAAAAGRLDRTRGPCPRRRAAARGAAGHRAGPHRELAAKGLARGALCRAVPWPGARAAARRRARRVRRPRRGGTRDGGAAAGRPARRDRPCGPAQPAGGRRLPRPMRAVRRQRFRPDAPCRGGRRADARPVRPDTGARNTRLPASVPPRCYRPAR